MLVFQSQIEVRYIHHVIAIRPNPLLYEQKTSTTRTSNYGFLLTLGLGEYGESLSASLQALLDEVVK